MDPQTAAARARSRTLVLAAAVPVGAVLAVLLGVLGLLVLGPTGLLVGLVLAAAVAGVGAWALATGAHRVALAATGARPADPTAHARLHNVVEGLCVGAGLPKPGLWVVDDPAPNALAVAGAADDAALVVTSGLLEATTRVELEAVLAHELARVKSGQAAVGSLAGVALVGPPALSIARPATGTPEAGPVPSLGPGRLALPLLLAAPLTAAVVSAAVPEPEGDLGDLAAVEITRYPPALERALAKVAEGPEVRSAPALAHLWLAPAAPGPRADAVARVFEPPLPLAQRIEALQEL